MSEHGGNGGAVTGHRAIKGARLGSKGSEDAGYLPHGHGARHVAIIMDGNGRWAKKRRVPRFMGHKNGVEAVRKTLKAARKFGLEAVTLYAFSSENWKRPEAEVSDLMGLLRHYIANEVETFIENRVRLKVIGDYRALSGDIVEMIEDVKARTAQFEDCTLAVALNYGGQDELVRTMQRIADKVAQGELQPSQIDIEMINGSLDTADIPPLDLLIRTSGELRLSNFLLWQAAYAELYFTDILWPDFDEAALAEALSVYAQRERRFGGR